MTTKWEKDADVEKPAEEEPEEQCSQCGAVILGYHACQGVPGWEDATMKISEYTGPRCSTCGGPRCVHAEGVDEGCRLCWLSRHTISDVRYSDGQISPGFWAAMRLWRGREEEANATHNDFAFLSVPERLALRARLEATGRPRAVLEPGPEPGSDEVRMILTAARFFIAGQHSPRPVPLPYVARQLADARVGHTRREVDETIARICPPESRNGIDARRLIDKPTVLSVGESHTFADGTVIRFDSADPLRVTVLRCVNDPSKPIEIGVTDSNAAGRQREGA